MFHLSRHALALGILVTVAMPAGADEAYQISTISSLLAGGYDGNSKPPAWAAVR
jgi:hypothetical protein